MGLFFKNQHLRIPDPPTNMDGLMGNLAVYVVIQLATASTILGWVFLCTILFLHSEVYFFKVFAFALNKIEDERGPIDRWIGYLAYIGVVLLYLLSWLAILWAMFHFKISSLIHNDPTVHFNTMVLYSIYAILFAIRLCLTIAWLYVGFVLFKVFIFYPAILFLHKGGPPYPLKVHILIESTFTIMIVFYFVFYVVIAIALLCVY